MHACALQFAYALAVSEENQGEVGTACAMAAAAAAQLLGGAVRAVDCAAYALLSAGHYIVPFDEVVRTMWETGCDMKSSYRETAQGGLAKIHLLRKHGAISYPGMGN